MREQRQRASRTCKIAMFAFRMIEYDSVLFVFPSLQQKSDSEPVMMRAAGVKSRSLPHTQQLYTRFFNWVNVHE